MGYGFLGHYQSPRHEQIAYQECQHAKTMKLIDYKDDQSFGNRLRRKRIGHVIDLMRACHNQFGQCRILDVGGTATYWKIYPPELMRELNVKITLLNMSLPATDSSSSTNFETLVGDACDMSMFSDGSFELVHSNSVIEHVGSWQRMQKMAAEVARVGKSYYLQTPYYWFPVEPHFVFPLLHWLPLSWRCKIAMSRPLGSWAKASTVSEAVIAQQSAVLLDASMAQALFPDARLRWEYFYGLRKSILMIRELSGLDR